MCNTNTEFFKGYDSYGETIHGEQSDSFWKGWEQAKRDKEREDFNNERLRYGIN